MIGLIRVLRRHIALPTLQDLIKHSPHVRGHLQVETREGGRLRQRAEGDNICTLTGREFLAERIALAAWSPRTLFRNDCIAYIGMGLGAQAEVSSIESLVDPTVYKAGEFLAALDAPAVFPSSGTSTSRTSVRFTREFSPGELSLGANVVLTEAGLFTDGDPDNNWDTTSTPTDFATAASRAPMFYKTYEPVTKTTSYTAKVIWTIRFE